MKHTSIQFEEVEFFQNDEKGKTVAYAVGHSLDAFIDFLNITHQRPPADHMDIPEELMMPYELKAISTCHSSDNWDPEVGKKQAFYKLVRMYNKMKRRAVLRGIKTYQNNLVCMDELVKAYDTKVSTYDRMVRYPKNPPKKENK